MMDGKEWISEGRDVRIFTARASKLTPEAEIAIRIWCKTFLGVELPITHCKDFEMEILYDDRAIGVVPNKGIFRY